MRYSGKIGFGQQTEVSPGVWEDTITERSYIGVVNQRTETLKSVDIVSPQYSTTTSISVLSDGVLKDEYSNIRYVTYMGNKWTIYSVVWQWPRLTIYIGDVYNGPK